MAIRVYLIGGTGNQYFQYKYALHMALNGAHVCLDASFLPSNQHSLEPLFNEVVLDITVSNTGSLQKQTIKKLYRRDLFTSYSGDQIITNKTIYLSYFQYLYEDSDVLNILKETSKLSHPTIHSPDKEYIALHYRVGDYRASKNKNTLGILAPKYYKTALSSFGNPNLLYTIISENDEDCLTLYRALIDEYPNYINKYHLAKRPFNTNSLFYDITTLSNASSLIIGNSSLSAAVAQLGTFDEVRYPYPWFTESELAKRTLPILKSERWTPILSDFV